MFEILALHTLDGPTERRLSANWINLVISQLAQRGLLSTATVDTKLTGDNARRASTVFAPTMADTDIRVVSCLGEGTSDAFLDIRRNPIYTTAAPIPNSEVNNRVFHMLSCSTADGLADSLIAAGCLAFIGYSDAVEIEGDDEWQKQFLACDALIDVELASGTPLGAAVDAGRKAFGAHMPTYAGQLLCRPSSEALLQSPLVTSIPTLATQVLSSRNIAGRLLPPANVIPNRMA
jgi:hypothetical protein